MAVAVANFNPVIAWLLYQEDSHSSPGKIVNLEDGAGLTRLGLTQRWNQQDLPADFFTTMEFKDAVAAAKPVYRQRYWNLISGELIQSDIVAAPLFSFAVNDNPLIAAKMLQKVLGVDDDGHIGKNTLAELGLKDPQIVAKMFRAEWETFYHNVVAVAPSKEKFLGGWINRVNFNYPPDEEFIKPIQGYL